MMVSRRYSRITYSNRILPFMFREFQIYEKLIMRLFPNSLHPLLALLTMKGIDEYRRYDVVSKSIVGSLILDVGSGGRSLITRMNWTVISLDIRRIEGIDIMASAVHLPFRDHVFDTVVCVDMFEHIVKKDRKSVLQELKRVATQKAVLHTPLDNGSMYKGRAYDLAFQRWYLKVYGCKETSTDEHISNGEPSPEELMNEGFNVVGTHNVELWIRCKCLEYMPTRPSFIGVVLGWLYYAVMKGYCQPPYWGGLAYYIVEEKTLPLS